MELSKEEVRTILDTMTWSYSRLSAYYNCRYEWFQNYVMCEDKIDNAFGQFGSFCHSLLERYEKGELDIWDLPTEYEEHYSENIDMEFPKNNYVDLAQKYYDTGLSYFESIDLQLDKYDILGVEEPIDFMLGDKYKFIGYIDLLLRDKETGAIIVKDHKSGSLKFKKDGSVSKSDEEHLEGFKRQLYLYSVPVIEKYGKVDYLEWNLFKQGDTLRIPFKQEEYENAIKWALDTIDAIYKEEEWLPEVDSYYCFNLCNQRANVCPYKP